MELNDKKIVIAAAFYALFAALTACGPQEVDVGGTITHKIELDVTKIESYFRGACEVEQPENVDSCTDQKMTAFLLAVIN